MSGTPLGNSSDLLRRLEPAVRPAARAAGAIAREAAPGLLEAQPFDRLLAQALAGEIRSGRPVKVGCDLKPALDGEQLARLAIAADKAEASGAQRALMMVDGRGVVLDVTGRMVIDEVKPDDTARMLQVDAAMVVPAEDAQGATTAAHRPGISLLPQNSQVARLLHRPIEAPAPASAPAR